MTTDLLQLLSIETGLGKRDLLLIIMSAPKRYKVFEIPKRRGGTRVIAQPSRELKAIQRFVLKNLLSKLPVHDCATGYVKERNIAQNAQMHAKSRVLLKLDFQDFFPSIKVRDWELYAQSRGIVFGPNELDFYSKILFWGERSARPTCLSIGAPTSPILSNILLFDVDSQLAQAAQDTNVIYTRYADDITASGASKEDVLKFEKMARAIIGATRSPRLVFNDDKRGLYTAGERKMVTGLVVTPKHEVSIGRERKRLISAMLHRLSVGKANAESMAELKGWLGFCLSVEPDFVVRMRDKYGNAVVDNVLRYHIIRKGLPVRLRR